MYSYKTADFLVGGCFRAGSGAGGGGGGGRLDTSSDELHMVLLD